MEQAQSGPLKLNYKRTMLIGFAFFGILLLWQVYDSWCPTFLTELFRKAIYLEDSYDVELILVPNTQELTEKDAVYVSSDDIKNFINVNYMNFKT